MEGQLLLKKNTTVVSDEKGLDKQIFSYQEFQPLYKQKPNKKFFLFIPREGIYYFLQRRKKKDDWIYRSLSKQSEKPSILDTSLARATVRNMYNQMYNKGYIYVSVDYEVKPKGKKAHVVYKVIKGPQLMIENVQYVADDPVIQQLLISSKDESFLRPGKPVDHSAFQSEKLRITQLLFDNGFADFNPVYIQPLNADTSSGKAKLVLKVSNPEGRAKHTQYKIKSITADPHYIITEADSNVKSTLSIDEVDFLQTDDFRVNEKVLRKRIYFRPGELYNRSLIDKTQLEMSRLGLYRFISIEPQLDSGSTTMLTYRINLTPYKKWVFDYGTDFNYTTIRSNVGKSLFGISGFANLKNRNLFGGAESFSTKVEAGTELNILNLRQSNSINLRYSNELSFPDFYDLTGTIGLGKLLLRPIKNFRKTPLSKTNFRLAIDYENLARQYWYASFNTEISYDFQIGRRERIGLTTLSFSLYIPDPEPSQAFGQLLDQNIFLKRSFTGKRLLTAFLFNRLNYVHQRKQRGNLSSTSITNIELSGLEIFLANLVYNKVTNSETVFAAKDLEFSRFLKVETDQRVHFNLPGNTSMAGRISAGMILPYGKKSTVPYVKQFYLGGPQGMRAWNIREVGPGGDTSNASKAVNRIFFSTGDFKLDMSLEYRFDLIWKFKGAFFADAGNVWLVPTKQTENNMGFLSSDFYKQIALGTGLGLRLDLSYFVFRIDWGIKLRNAFRDNNQEYWIYSSRNPIALSKLIKNSNLHLALNYPF